MANVVDAQKKFWNSVAINQLDECWPWKKSNSGGYGCAYVLGFPIKAHRAAFWFAFGFDAGEWCVCHRCDTPICCNPGHLFLGSHLDNMRDCRQKGRKASLKGETNGNSKLTPELVLAIRENYKWRSKDGCYVALAKRFNISATLVRFVVVRKNWKHV